ncbi:MAG: hypothetical protein WC558_05275 [Patulibacter sp.]
MAVALATAPTVVVTTSAHASGPAKPLTLSASWGPGARSGARAPLRLALTTSPHAPTVEDVRIFLAAGIDLAGTRLGDEACRILPSVFGEVLLGRVGGDPPCPRNALIGVGEATAVLRVNEYEPPIFGSGRLSLFNAVEHQGHGGPGIAVTVNTDRPIVSTLFYSGDLSSTRPPYGLRIRIRVPQPRRPPFGATVALRRLVLDVGSPEILYSAKRRGRTVYYRPGGFERPRDCDRIRGLSFRAEVRFAGGSRGVATTRISCS